MPNIAIIIELIKKTVLRSDIFPTAPNPNKSIVCPGYDIALNTPNVVVLSDFFAVATINDLDTVRNIPKLIPSKITPSNNVSVVSAKCKTK